jgi:prepilin-type N-terminal cleavage/methylation domain-containing protein
LDCARISTSGKSAALGNERGFTLPEVLIVIVIMGILFGIATSTWFGVIEGRRVDSATNQIVADLRLVHTTATNRLTPQQVSITAGSSEYSMTGVASPRDLDEEPGRNEIVVDITSTIMFCSNGGASATTSDCSDDGESPITFKVSSEDGAPNHEIEIIPTTSRVKVDD